MRARLELEINEFRRHGMMGVGGEKEREQEQGSEDGRQERSASRIEECIYMNVSTNA